MATELTTGNEYIVAPTHEEAYTIKKLQLKGAPQNVVIVEMPSTGPIPDGWVTRLGRWTDTKGQVYQSDAHMMVMYPEVDYNAMYSLGMITPPQRGS